MRLQDRPKRQSFKRSRSEKRDVSAQRHSPDLVGLYVKIRDLGWGQFRPVLSKNHQQKQSTQRGQSRLYTPCHGCCLSAAGSFLLTPDSSQKVNGRADEVNHICGPTWVPNPRAQSAHTHGPTLSRFHVFHLICSTSRRQKRTPVKWAQNAQSRHQKGTSLFLGPGSS